MPNDPTISVTCDKCGRAIPDIPTTMATLRMDTLKAIVQQWWKEASTAALDARQIQADNPPSIIPSPSWIRYTERASVYRACADALAALIGPNEAEGKERE